jgi:proline iminopeptidase
MLATAYVNEHPGKISGLVLAEPGGFVWKDVKAYVDRSRDYRFTGEAFNDVQYGDQFLSGSEDEHEILDYKYILLAVAEGTKESPIGNDGLLPFWRPGAVANMALFDFAEKNGFDVRANLPLFTTKALFLYSERNKAYGLEHAQLVSSAFPNVQLSKIDGAGHDFISFSTGWQNFYPTASSYLAELNQ